MGLAIVQNLTVGTMIHTKFVIQWKSTNQLLAFYGPQDLSQVMLSLDQWSVTSGTKWRIQTSLKECCHPIIHQQWYQMMTCRDIPENYDDSQRASNRFSWRIVNAAWDVVFTITASSEKYK